MGIDYTPKQVNDLVLQGDVQLLDVRQPHEYEAGHISDSRLVPLSELASGASALDRERPVIVLCRSGGRSAMATQALTEAGFDAHNMTGGMLEWHAGGLPIEPTDGFVADP